MIDREGYLRVMSILGHELRTPLTVIRGAATLVVQAYDQLPRDRLIEMLRLIDDNSETMAERIEDMLSLSHLDAGDLRLNVEPVPVADIVAPAVASAERLGLARVEAEGDTDGVMVQADQERSVQTLRSLLANIVRGSGRGGVVRLSVKPHAEQVRFEMRSRGKDAPASVASSGPEPAPSSITDVTSAGDLNAYLASGLASAMGGEVGTDAGEDGSAVVWFTLIRHV